MRIKLISAALSLSLWMAFGPSGSMASSLGLYAYDRGWYREYNGGIFHMPHNTNILTGRYFNGEVYRHFQAFDLSAATGHYVTSARLSYLPYGEYASIDFTETVGFFDFTGNIDHLLVGAGGLTAFNDLGEGEMYGSIEFDRRKGGRYMQSGITSLNAAAIADINAAIMSPDQRFVFGAALTDLTLTYGVGDQILWSYSNRWNAATLSLDFGEPPPQAGLSAPGALALLSLGVLGLSFRRRPA